MQIVLRIFVALLALAGTGGASFFALGLSTVVTEADEKTKKEIGMSVQEAVKLSKTALAEKMATSPTEADRVKKDIERARRVLKVVDFFFLAAAFGLLGMLLAVCGKGKSAAALLLVAPVGPILLLYGIDDKLLIIVAAFIGALPLAGLLSLFVGPSRRGGPVRDAEV